MDSETPTIQSLSNDQIAKILQQQLGINLPLINIAQTVSKYSAAILPYIMTGNIEFTVAGDVQTFTYNIDASYYFLGWGMSVIMSSKDIDTVLNFIQVDTLTNYLKNPLPAALVKQYTTMPVPLNLVVKANLNLQVEVRNGSTTGTNHFYLSFHGQRIPINLIQQLGAMV